MKALTKRTNCTFTAKKVEGHDQKNFQASDPTFKFVPTPLTLLHKKNNRFLSSGVGLRLHGRHLWFSSRWTNGCRYDFYSPTKTSILNATLVTKKHTLNGD